MRNAKSEAENVINGRLIRTMLVVLGVRRTAQRRGSRRFNLVCGGLVVLLGMIAVATSAFAQATPAVALDEPIGPEVVQNPCTGEFVSLSGRQVVTVYAKTNASGGMHFTFRTITKEQGSNNDPLNPKNYVLNDENVTELNVPSSDTQEFTEVINHALIRQSETTVTTGVLGGGDDFMKKSTLHVTFFNFVPFVTIDNGHTACM